MAVSVLVPLLIPLGEQITNVTQLENVGHLSFERASYEVSVPENTAPLAVLVLLASTNATQGPVLYSVAGGGAAGSFEADVYTGELTLIAPLDYELSKTREVLVAARSGRERAYCRVLVRVLDQNDHSPVLARPFYETQVTEEDDRHLPKTIVQVSAHDEDDSDADKLRYFLSGDGVYSPYDVAYDVPTTGRGKGEGRGQAAGREGGIRSPWNDPNNDQVVLTPNGNATIANDGHYPRAPVHRNSSNRVDGLSIGGRDGGNEEDEERGNDTASPARRNNSTSHHRKDYRSSFNSSNVSHFKYHRHSINASKAAQDSNISIRMDSSILGNSSGISRGRHRAYSGGSDGSAVTIATNDNERAREPDNVGSIRRRPGHFTINERTGTVQLIKPLDRDAPHGRARWALSVSVSDGSHSARAQLLVNVKDINDNAPFFPEAVMEATVRENSPAGTEVVQVSATDYDDPNEGDHAMLFYTLEKNVIDQSSGRAIFIINSTSGSIRTAMCCLDREQTASYGVQVVATDGGGLKGTGSVLVTVGDENDVVPVFAEPHWRVVAKEATPANQTLAMLAVTDPDLTNVLAFRVVPGSGPGWDRFDVFPVPGSQSGALVPKTSLDYEDQKQQRGFSFKVEVTDQGPDWGGRRASSMVNVRLVDSNDHRPVLSIPVVSLSIKEDAAPGTRLTTIRATDGDQGRNGELVYRIAPRPGRQPFAVDGEGHVSLQLALDRETRGRHLVEVQVADRGWPAHTVTATIVVEVQDVNDNAPQILRHRDISVWENSPASELAHITLYDADDRSLGHGPPFTFQLDPEAPAHIKKDFALKYLADGDHGRGSATLSSRGPLDRETPGPMRLVPIVVGDAGGLTRTASLTVLIGDRNDNPAQPGTKTVHVTRLKTQHRLTPLGRVFVQDADDWDVGEKHWSWKESRPHPLFSLDPDTGQLALLPSAPDGTYRLSFVVSEPKHKQLSVPANVTVVVSSLLDEELVANSVPLLVSSHSPQQMIATPEHDDETPLERLLSTVKKVTMLRVRLVALHGRQAHQTTNNQQLYTNITPHRERSSSKGSIKPFKTNSTPPLSPPSSSKDVLSLHPSRRGRNKQLLSNESSRADDSDDPFSHHERVGSHGENKVSSQIWLAGPAEEELGLLLLRYKNEISRISGVRVLSVAVSVCGEVPGSPPTSAIMHPYYDDHQTVPTAGTKAKFPEEASESESPAGSGATPPNGDSLGETAWLVDANSTALVTPRVVSSLECSACRGRQKGYSFPSLVGGVEEGSCRPNPCRNGGRCVLADDGFKCICPEGSKPPFCKILSRFFPQPAEGRRGGWLWLNPDGRFCPHIGDGGSKIPHQDGTNDTRHKASLNTHPEEDPFLRREGAVPEIFGKGGCEIFCSGHVSVEFRTQKSTCLLFYAGPVDIERRGDLSSTQVDLVSLELQEGAPRLLFALGGRAALSVSPRTPSLADNTWHRIDVSWAWQGVEMLVDSCRGQNTSGCRTSHQFPSDDGNYRYWEDNFQVREPPPVNGTLSQGVRSPTGGKDASNTNSEINLFTSDAKWSRPLKSSYLHNSGEGYPMFPPTPLQLGGLAHPPPDADLLGGPISKRHFEGCIRNFRLNGELLDLGGGEAVSHLSQPHCPPSDPCTLQGTPCPPHSRCESGPGAPPVCGCHVGHMGLGCLETAPAITLQPHSYIKLALSFTPPPLYTDLRLRFRTRASWGQLVSVSSQHRRDTFALRLQEGRLCLSLVLGTGSSTGHRSTLCLSRVPLNDGAWHTVSANRYGRLTELSVDGGDHDLYNSSFSTSFGGGHSSLTQVTPITGYPQHKHARRKRTVKDIGRETGKDMKQATGSPDLRTMLLQQNQPFANEEARKRLHQEVDGNTRRSDHSKNMPHFLANFKASTYFYTPKNEQFSNRYNMWNSSFIVAKINNLRNKFSWKSDDQEVRSPPNKVSMTHSTRNVLSVRYTEHNSKSNNHVEGRHSTSTRNHKNSWKRSKKFAEAKGEFTDDIHDAESNDHGWRGEIVVDRQEGVLIGGVPTIDVQNIFSVVNDLHTACVSDVRVWGQALPLPPASNTTAAAQVTALANVRATCTGPSACSNVSCEAPFVCRDVWHGHSCGCPSGEVTVGDACLPLNECLWRPCLHAGLCTDLSPGYLCTCPPSYTGVNCERTTPTPNSPDLGYTLGTIAAVLAWLLLLFVLAVAYSMRGRCRSLLGRSSSKRGLTDPSTASTGGSLNLLPTALSSTQSPATKTRVRTSGTVAAEAPAPISPKGRKVRRNGAALEQQTTGESRGQISLIDKGQCSAQDDSKHAPHPITIKHKDYKVLQVHLPDCKLYKCAAEISKGSIACEQELEKEIGQNCVGEKSPLDPAVAIDTAKCGSDCGVSEPTALPSKSYRKENETIKKQGMKDGSINSCVVKEYNAEATEKTLGCGCPQLPSLDDLRNYAYEGEGSSPGSLSSCCSGGGDLTPNTDGTTRFMGGFQDVAILLNCLNIPKDSQPYNNNGSCNKPKQMIIGSVVGCQDKLSKTASPQTILRGKSANIPIKPPVDVQENINKRLYTKRSAVRLPVTPSENRSCKPKKVEQESFHEEQVGKVNFPGINFALPQRGIQLSNSSTPIESCTRNMNCSPQEKYKNGQNHLPLSFHSSLRRQRTKKLPILRLEPRLNNNTSMDNFDEWLTPLPPTPYRNEPCTESLASGLNRLHLMNTFSNMEQPSDRRRATDCFTVGKDTGVDIDERYLSVNITLGHIRGDVADNSTKSANFSINR